MNTNRMAVWQAFLRAHATVVQILEREMEETQGLPLTWYDILYQLEEASGGRLRMQTLADSIVLSRSGLTRLIDRMEKSGLVRREPCVFDRRGYYTVITEKGKSVLEGAAPVHWHGVQEHFAQHLLDAEVTLLYAALIRIIEANHNQRPGSCQPERTQSV